MPRFSVVWLLSIFLPGVSSTAFSFGHFVIKRQPESCSSITALVTDSSPAQQPNCLTYRTAELRQAFHYVTYTRDFDFREYQLRMATLNVSGQLGDYDLSFHCPTASYYGTPAAYCSSAPGMQLAAVHATANHTLYELDVILSPAQYPPVEALVPNQPPFGIAQIKLPFGIPLPESGFLQICMQDLPGLGCIAVEQRLLPDPLPSNVGAGTFTLAQYGLSLPSDWVMDGANELLVVAAGPNRYYFNSAGFYLSQAGTCSFHTHKNFESEVYTYDSRFLDFVGTITVTSHYGHTNFQPERVTLFVGLAFDAAKIDPVIQFFDVHTGFYRGMNAFDVVKLPTLTYGAAYWYPTIAPTPLGDALVEYAARMANLSDPCTSHFNDWLYPNTTRTCTGGLVLSNGLCRDPSRRRVLDAAPSQDSRSYAEAQGLKWVMTFGPALAFALALLISGLLLLAYQKRTKPFTHGDCVPTAPQAFETL